nr:MAG TPA: hypothetical protein [Caudoviricetes sp.]
MLLSPLHPHSQQRPVFQRIGKPGWFTGLGYGEAK